MQNLPAATDAERAAGRLRGQAYQLKWSKITKFSQNTPLRNILDLTLKGILCKEVQGGHVAPTMNCADTEQLLKKCLSVSSNSLQGLRSFTLYSVLAGNIYYRPCRMLSASHSTLEKPKSESLIPAEAINPAGILFYC